MPILSVQDVGKKFGGLKALDGINIAVEPGELVGLIGPNGSGKTTLINILSGFLAPDAGRVTLDGRDIAGHKPQALARLGIVRTFQLTRIFPRMSVLDNLILAGCALGLAQDQAEQRARALAADLSVAHVQDLDAGKLSGGQLKLVEFGACFMVPPRVALLDEPFAAIHPTMKEIMAGFIRARHAQGQTFVLVSHDMPVIVELCPRTVCMNAGAVIADGTTRTVLNSAVVIEAYLGEAAA